MPYSIVKRGKDYILKSPKREYKHKTLSKAKAQKKLLQEKEIKQKQSQKQKQVVIVNVNAPSKRRVGSTRKTTAPPQIQEQVIRMIPSITPFGIQEQLAQARPLQTNLLEDDRIGRLEKSIQELRDPFLKKEEDLLVRESSKRDSELIPIYPSIFEPQVPTSGRAGITRQLSIDSIFNGATIGQLIQGDFGATPSGRPRTEPTTRQLDAIKRWKEQNP